MAVSHASICNFVRVAAETYGYSTADRVYQGLTMAFDFAVEETWVPTCQGCGSCWFQGKPARASSRTAGTGPAGGS